jgi:hypothetical protein
MRDLTVLCDSYQYHARPGFSYLLARRQSATVSTHHRDWAVVFMMVL